MKKYSQFFLLSGIIILNVYANESFLIDEVDSSAQLQKQPSNRFSILKEIVCNVAARVYYATSVAGYGSCDEGVDRYLKGIFQYKPTWTASDYRIICVSEKLGQNDDLKRNETLPTFVQKLEEGVDRQDVLFPYYYKKDEQGKIWVVPMNMCLREMSGDKKKLKKHPLFGNSFYSPRLAALFMDHLIQRFGDQSLTIYSFFDAEQPTTSLGHWLTGSSTASHYVYTHISFKDNKNSLKVKILDPCHSWIGEGFLKGILTTENTHQAVTAYFKECGNALQKDVDFDYVYQADQVLNMNDCSRFSTIYLEKGIEGFNLDHLTPVNVYEGFDKLYYGGFDKDYRYLGFKEKPLYPQSFFVKYISTLWRTPANWILRYLRPSASTFQD